jgi:putative transposase
MSPRRRRERVEPTDEWELLLPLFWWPEQENYEEIRPLVLFGESVAERASQVGTSASTLYRRVDRFESEGIESLFNTKKAKKRRLPPAVRRLIVNLKGEYPPMSLAEIANICYVHSGRKPSKHTVKRVLSEDPIPLKMMKRFDPYHEIPEPKERRMAVVRLHSQGWTPKSIAGYLKTHKSTVYRVLRRWIEEGEDGLEDKPHGRPPSIRKVDLKAIDAVRRLQQNPELGEFRVHAALAQMGIDLSPATCGRILALNRRLYGLGIPKGGPRQKKEMPFATSKRHVYWTIDVRYVDRHGVGGKVYVISILENHSRAILSSAVSRSQDTTAYLSVLYAAVERYGSPETIVTDGGAIFRANPALSIYEALDIAKEEIERGKPWQSYIETTFNIQHRMGDWHFARAQNWAELVAVHDSWVDAYNHQSHWAHRDRKDGRRAPLEVLGWVSGRRHESEKLARAFFSSRFARTLNPRGYARFRHWLVYGDEGLARCEAALWLSKENLTVEFHGQLLSRYDVTYIPGTDRLREVKSPTLFETPYVLPQLRLFELDDTEWLKALKVGEYALRRLRRPQALQDVLFSYTKAH